MNPTLLFNQTTHTSYEFHRIGYQLEKQYMGNPTTKLEIMKPIFLKAGIPLALSVVGFIYVRIISRRSFTPKASTLEIPDDHHHHHLSGNSSLQEFSDDEESYHSFEARLFVLEEDGDEKIVENTRHSDFLEKLDISGLRSLLENLQQRELELEARFVRYCDLKDQEAWAVELQSMLTLEMAQIELLGREISYMEVEYKMFEELAIEFLRIGGQLELSRTENELLHGRIKKHCQVIEDNSSKMEAEILEKNQELDDRSNVIKALEAESQEMQGMIYQLLTEKSELSSQLSVAEESNASKDVTIADYKQVANELEELRKERAVELKELAYLKWSNACLRHELMRTHEQQEENQEKSPLNKFHVEGDASPSDEHGAGTCSGTQPCSHNNSSRRPKLLQKLRRKWMEGRGKMKGRSDEKERLEGSSVCYGRHSVSDVAEEHHFHPRWSSSSA